MGEGGTYTLAELARALGATLEGDGAIRVRAVAPPETAGPDDVAFLLSPKAVAAAAGSRAGALVVAADAPALARPHLRVSAPRLALAAALRLFHPEPPMAPGVHPLACVATGARVAASASIGPYAVIEAGASVGERTRVGALVFVGAGTTVGSDVRLHPGVVVREGVHIGDRVIVHPGSVIGADGFGFEWDGAAHRKIPQVGGVRIGDDVEIGANATLDRGTLGDTVIGRGTKIDNLVQIGHNCVVGEHAILVAQVGVSGSSRIGHGAVLAGQVGVADHVTVGDRAILLAQAGVPADVPAGEVWSGTPARAHMTTRRIWVAETALPELLRRVRALEQRLAALEPPR